VPEGIQERFVLISGRVQLALDRLVEQPGTPLLLLHPLGADASHWLGRPGLFLGR